MPMKTRVLLVAFFCFWIVNLNAQMEKHRWKDRVILLFADNKEASSYRAQLKTFKGQEAALEDRNLVLYRIFNTEGTGPDQEALPTRSLQQLTKRYRDRSTPFTFVLLGKDGGVKWRSTEPVSKQDLYALIDGMPMRRAEMRRKSGSQ